MAVPQAAPMHPPICSALLGERNHQPAVQRQVFVRVVIVLECLALTLAFLPAHFLLRLALAIALLLRGGGGGLLRRPLLAPPLLLLHDEDWAVPKLDFSMVPTENPPFPGRLLLKLWPEPGTGTPSHMPTSQGLDPSARRRARVEVR